MSIDKIRELVTKRVSLAPKSVQNTLELLQDGATIPFIARYRKEATGSLDEVQIAAISTAQQQVLELVSRKEYILSTIKEQGQLTDNLQRKINECWDPTLLEDIYLPYKRKKQTKAEAARKAGLEPLANTIFRSKTMDLNRTALTFVKGEIEDTEQAIAGARDIIAEWISEHQVARKITREIFQRSAVIHSKLIKSKQSEAEKYKNYWDFSQPLKRIPSHRLLAMLRGETEKLLRIKLVIDDEWLTSRLNSYFSTTDNECSAEVQVAIQDALKRLIIPSISNEFRKTAKDKADDEAIGVFSENLRQLILSPPLGEKAILAIDPGFRTGCKIVALNDQSDLNSYKTIYPHPPQNKLDESRSIIANFIDRWNIKDIAIGNGTAGKETLEWLNSWVPESVNRYLVNEQGASIYSASELAREEFPDLDLTIRGAISIGRRLMDPLAELVKIDPKSIGVGQYQHDVNQVKLKSKLDQVVINAVNKVGINANTASKHVLNYISGLGPALAQNIVDFRTEHHGIHSKASLMKVPRMGAKSFEQAAGFLRIKNGENPLDNTGVHPEAYHIVSKIARSLHVEISDLLENKLLLDQLNPTDFITDKIGLPTILDIIQELNKPGIDPRGDAKPMKFTKGLEKISDLKIGMEVIGIINNMTKFGAFVDIGIKENGLIHISQITNKYISDPSEILSLGQEVTTRVIDIDIDRKRISLSMKDLD